MGVLESFFKRERAEQKFLLANHVSQGRSVADAREAFRETKTVAKTEARVILTDGLPSYATASQKEFPDAVHISGIGIQGRVNNNRMERYHGTFKERSKVMRAIKKRDSAFIEGQRIYYNYIRPHTALNGKTPAEVAKISVDSFDNKWQALIQNASKENRIRRTANGKCLSYGGRRGTARGNYSGDYHGQAVRKENSTIK
jgi:transposase